MLTTGQRQDKRPSGHHLWQQMNSSHIDHHPIIIIIIIIIITIKNVLI